MVRLEMGKLMRNESTEEQDGRPEEQDVLDEEERRELKERLAETLNEYQTESAAWEGAR